MRKNDYEHLLKEIRGRAIGSTDEYISLMKAMGNNHKHTFQNQLSIYSKDYTYRACTSFDMWQNRFGRVVKKGEKGIPVENRNGKIGYVFNVTQTVSTNNKASEVYIWSLENGNKTLQGLLESKDIFGKSELAGMTDDIMLDNIARMEVVKNCDSLINELKIPRHKRKDFIDFLTESVKTAYAIRLDMKYY